MAKTHTVPTPPATNNDHWNSGSLLQRGAYALFEQVAHAGGLRAGKTSIAKNLADTVLGRLGGAASSLATGGATVAAATLINADFFGEALAKRLGLPADRVKELANEGLDEFVRGTIEGASKVDSSLPIEEQNRELRRIAEEQFGVYTSEVARRNAHLLREVIIAPCDGMIAWHAATCPNKSSVVGRDGVRKVKWFERPKGTVRAACICQATITFRGTLNEVFDHLSEAGNGAMVTEVLAAIAADEFKDVRGEFLAKANAYDQATVGMVERALVATDSAIRRGLLLELVGIQPKSAAEVAAAAPVTKVKKFLTDPTSPTRVKIDREVTKFATTGSALSAAARRKR